ncbi:hypothetical protein N657DRAFT_681407 [Parathielavia appendiculata]|uniref:Uncharacterized protein n=1 Tax=Parathielavia appendiculata TaxID=2587402 RepID=A0AAN6U010_9PEZI|nr:hypothetical protein N657DRAFT_681407 [Parathielavia appendiculata]
MRLQTLAITYPNLKCIESAMIVHTEFLARPFRAAPSINKMTLFALWNCPNPGSALEKLTSLDFRASVLDYGELVKNLLMCPNLETFKYEAGRAEIWDDHFSLPQAQQAILAHELRLKFLRLSTAHGAQHRSEELDWGPKYAPEMQEILAENCQLCLRPGDSFLSNM